MKPGKELDKLVAEKAMKLQVTTKVTKSGNKIYSLGPAFYDDYAGEMILSNPLPDYSTDIAAAWKVVEHLGGNFGLMKIEGLKNYQAHIGTMEEPWIDGETAPHAICLAALKAMEAK